MQFGLFLTMPAASPRPAGESYARAMDMACSAEALGFSHFWLAEHHFTNYSHSSRPLLLLAHIAARTHRIRLGPAIVPVPLHHPLTIAEEIATLDVLSRGRAELGIGMGYQRYQYERFQINRTTNVQRDEEAQELLLTALRRPSFSFAGNHFTTPPTHLVPQPMQRTMPVWMVVNSSKRQSIERAVAHGANMFTGVLEPISRLTNPRLAYPDLAPRLVGLRIGTQRPVYVAENEADAADAIAQARWNGRATWRMRFCQGGVVDGHVPVEAIPGEPSDAQLRDDHLIIGNTDECIHQLRRIREGLGCDYFSASFWFGDLSHPRVLASMRRFAHDVMPVLQQDAARAVPTTHLI
ncbi:LLM class flavin-dependent oxidoreductase [Robbsia andropogonis]|uniref:LLM class flavin-dependent oxidoreductase n=1 Tax=Robbsia andropogonis TaxID=28092 RepID=UPI0004663F3D|nr:LLM class flavin-dependent oxidoreductase [Robbsia andropogonis]MCP1119722.1 LLM class flavin-dependent oxidoreductase [Robbsia andropogonis]MCP1129705.1 LLM class flavin-dependent oxidoreductase [Robbsia andropogonis]